MPCENNAGQNDNIIVEQIPRKCGKLQSLGNGTNESNCLHKKFKTDEIQGMVQNIQYRIVCHSLCYLGTQVF